MSFLIGPKFKAPLFLLVSGYVVGAQGGVLEEANRAYGSNRPQEAVRLYRTYLQEHPDRADVRVFLGAALLNLDQVDEAGFEAKRAIALNPALARAHSLAGRVFAARRLWRDAQAEFSVAEQLSPKDRDNPYFSGHAYLDANQFENAIRKLQQAAALGYDKPRLYENLGIAYAATGSATEADFAYRQAVAKAGSDSQPFYRYGEFLFEEQRLQESEANLQEALRRNSEHPGIRFALARVLFHTGKIQEAASLLEQIRSSRECRVHALLSRIYAKQRRQSELDEEEKAIAGCSSESK